MPGPDQRRRLRPERQQLPGRRWKLQKHVSRRAYVGRIVAMSRRQPTYCLCARRQMRQVAVARLLGKFCYPRPGLEHDVRPVWRFLDAERAARRQSCRHRRQGDTRQTFR